METKKGLRAIIPAAGKGKRLHSTEDLPKVMHRACGKPLLETVLEQMSFIDVDDIYIVVGFQKEKVMEYFGDKYHYVEQKEQLGTGHAVLVCEFRGHALVPQRDPAGDVRAPHGDGCGLHAADDGESGGPLLGAADPG